MDRFERLPEETRGRLSEIRSQRLEEIRQREEAVSEEESRLDAHNRERRMEKYVQDLQNSHDRHQALVQRFEEDIRRNHSEISLQNARAAAGQYGMELHGSWSIPAFAEKRTAGNRRRAYRKSVYRVIADDAERRQRALMFISSRDEVAAENWIGRDENVFGPAFDAFFSPLTRYAEMKALDDRRSQLGRELNALRQRKGFGVMGERERQDQQEATAVLERKIREIKQRLEMFFFTDEDVRHLLDFIPGYDRDEFDAERVRSLLESLRKSFVEKVRKYGVRGGASRV